MVASPICRTVRPRRSMSAADRIVPAMAATGAAAVAIPECRGERPSPAWKRTRVDERRATCDGQGDARRVDPPAGGGAPSGR